jgi:hypothetical protein
MADIETRIKLLKEFDSAPPSIFLPPVYLAAVRDCSESTLARDRSLGRGCPFVRLGKRVLYRKVDILKWLEEHQPVCPTAEARLQAKHLQGGLSDAPSSAASAERHKPIRSTAEADAQAMRLREALNVAVAASGEG